MPINICNFTPIKLSERAINDRFKLVQQYLCYALSSTGGIVTANDGLSVSSGNVVLGQAIGEVGAPATLLTSREIPTGGNNVFWTGTGRSSFGYTNTATNPTTTVDIRGTFGVNTGAGYSTSFNSNVGATMYVSHQGGTWGLNITKSGAGSANYGALLSFYRTSGADASTRAGVVAGQPIGSTIYQCVAVDNATVATVAVMHCRVASSTTSVVRGYITFVTSRSNGFVDTERLVISAEGNVSIGDGIATLGESDSSKLRVAQQTLSGSEAFNLAHFTSTWNTTGTPTALKVNVTDTASDTASLLADFQVGGISKWRLSKAGTVGIALGATANSALLHIAAGTATAGTAPIKLTAGTNLTAPEDGTFEFDGTNLYFTVGGVRRTVTLV